MNQKSDIDKEAYNNAWAEWAREQMPSTDANIKAPGFVMDEKPSEIENKLGLSLIKSATSFGSGPSVQLSDKHTYCNYRHICSAIRRSERKCSGYHYACGNDKNKY